MAKAQEEVRRFEIVLTGINALLMHQDSVEWRDQMAAWLAEPENKQVSKAGDDRTPAWQWMGGLYHDGEYVALPASNIMKCLMSAGAMVQIAKGQNRTTFKSKTQSGMTFDSPFLQLTNGGRRIKISDLNHLLGEPDYTQHLQTVRQLGFDLDCRPVKIGKNKHIRVRPIFKDWSASGVMMVWDPLITDNIFKDFWEYAGRYKGVGDWRPSAPTSPGSHGIFETKIKKLK